MPALEFSGYRQQGPLDSAPFHLSQSPGGTPWAAFHHTAGTYLVRFPGLCDFDVSADGRSVSAWAVPGTPADTVEHLHLNQVTPLALSRQGKLVLHGSAIEIGGRAVAFLGASGRGKSTLAASFARTGHGLLSDDGLVLAPGDAGWDVEPSHPSIRLWEDSEIALHFPTTTRAAPLEFTSKSRFLAGEGIAASAGPRPLHHLYFLGTGVAADPSFQPLSEREALMELVAHSFLLDVLDAGALKTQFDQLCELVKHSRSFTLDYPREFARLPALREAIARHAASSAFERAPA